MSSTMLDIKNKNRLMRDIKYIKENPIPKMHLEFDPENMLTWYYIIEGSEGTPFEGGFYFGRIELPINYPFYPPAVVMITPSGRFKTETSLCFSYTNYHPESWSAALNPSHVALGLVSFMNDFSDRGVGCINSTESEIKKLALASKEFNMNNTIVQSLFPDVVKMMKERSKQEQ